LTFEVLEEGVCHVGALSEHIIEVAKALLPGRFLSLDGCMHLIAFPIDISNDFLFVRDSRSFLLDKTISDSFHLRTDRVQSIVVILNSIFLFLNDSSFKFIP
jgi:hypothetical protein